MRAGIAFAALVALLAMPANAQTVTRQENTPGAVAATTTTATDGTGQTLRVPIVATISTTGNANADVQGTGTLGLTTLNATYVIPLSNGRSILALRLSGLTGSGATITVERSNDGGTIYTSANTTEGSATASLSSTITTDGQPRLNAAGATNIRLRVSTAGTGTLSIAYNATNAAGPVFLVGNLPSYSTPDGRIIGGVDNRFVAGNAISVGTGVTDTGTQRVSLATDTPLAGTFSSAGAITAPTAGATFPFQLDASGNLRVVTASAAASVIPVDGNNTVTVPYARQASNNGVTTAFPTPVLGYVWNGSFTYMTRGDATGTWIGGHASLGTGQVSVTTASTLVAAARTGRQKIILSVGAANTCAFGNTGVTTTTGFPLQPTAGASLTLDTSAAIYAACSATTTVSYIEQY